MNNKPYMRYLVYRDGKLYRDMPTLNHAWGAFKESLWQDKSTFTIWRYQVMSSPDHMIESHWRLCVTDVTMIPLCTIRNGKDASGDTAERHMEDKR